MREGRVLVRAVMATMVLVAGCQFDEQYTGLSDKALPGDPLNPILPDAQQCTCNCTGGGGVVDVAGMAWRFDALALAKPTPLLNDMFSGQIKDGTLVVLLAADAQDKDAGTLAMRIGGGSASGEDAFKLADDASPLSCTLAGATFKTAEPATLALPVEMLSPPVLRITSLAVTGSFSGNGDAVSDGTIKGVLAAADAAAAKFGDKDLGTMLRQFGVPPDLPTDAPDGQKDSWTVDGTFTAAGVTLVQ